MGELAAGLTHEMNNVLNAVLAASFLVEVSAGDERAVREYSKRIAEAVTNASAQLAPLRHFMRQQPFENHQAEMVDMTAAVSEVLAAADELCAMREPENAVTIVRTMAGGLMVRGIGSDLRVVVRNLVYNALDAVQDGGTITVVTAFDDGTALVEVRDTGVGMQPEVRVRALEPFFSTKGGRGNGLGLSEVYGIVKRHRGVTEIESAPGRGTVVRLRFPLASLQE
jgi:signal transduction histidine kinase